MDLDMQKNIDINCFVIMISGNIYFSDVLMVFINIYYIL